MEDISEAAPDDTGLHQESFIKMKANADASENIQVWGEKEEGEGGGVESGGVQKFVTLWTGVVRLR